MGEIRKRNGVSSQGEKRVACLRCRQKHIRCPGGDPCAKCEQSNAKCEYQAPTKKVAVNVNFIRHLNDGISDLKKENERLRSVIAMLQSKNHKLEAQAHASKSDVERISGRFHSENVTEEEDGDDDGELIASSFAQRSGRLIESHSGLRYFVGSSSMTLFGLEIQSLISHYVNEKNLKPLPINLKLENRTDLTDYKKFLEDAGANNQSHQLTGLSPVEKIIRHDVKKFEVVLSHMYCGNSDRFTVTLPDYEYAVLLVEKFITFNDGCFYFFNEGLVRKGLDIVYADKELLYKDDDTLQTMWFCKLFLIFAMGEMYLCSDKMISKISVKSIPGFEFFSIGSKLFNCLFSGERLECATKEGGIEVLLLYAFYLQVADCTVASYFYIGQAVRSCLILGMHVDAQSDIKSRAELEHQRRLWWTVYMFERMLSSKAGLPLSLSDATIATELPSDLGLHPTIDEHFIFSPAENIDNCIAIVRINAQILKKMYQRQPNYNILPVLKSVIQSLLEWRNTLPDTLQVDFTKQDLEITRLGTNIFTEFFQGINLAIRPLLFHFTSVQLKKFKASNTYVDLAKYSSTISSLLNCSLQASVNTIRSLWELMEQNMVAVFGYMDREYLFTSSCTLLLFNVAFGIHEQTNEYLDYALDMLTTMKTMGNVSAGLRRAQLLTLMMNMDFHAIMRDLISKHSDSFQQNDEELLNNLEKHETKEATTLFNAIKGTLEKSYEIPITKLDTEIMEQNLNQLEQVNNADNDDLQEILDGMDYVDQTDSKLWKEISDQAMWLGDTMDPTAAIGIELELGDNLLMMK
ncbi:Put3p [Nakaseomyces bracarensis]|uniref:Put3p n=1 Tax=Nakaseomyces bracarensis TaxID=273131 RepID=UPI003871F527